MRLPKKEAANRTLAQGDLPSAVALVTGSSAHHSSLSKKLSPEAHTLLFLLSVLAIIPLAVLLQPCHQIRRS